MLAARGLAGSRIVIATPTRDGIIMTLIPPNGTILPLPKNPDTLILLLEDTTSTLF